MGNNFDRVAAQNYMDLHLQHYSLLNSHADLVAIVEALLDKPNDANVIKMAKATYTVAKARFSNATKDASKIRPTVGPAPSHVERHQGIPQDDGYGWRGSRDLGLDDGSGLS